MDKIIEPKINILELFAGKRALYKAFLNLNIKVNVVDCIENDPKVVDISNSIYGTNYKPKSVINYHYQDKEKIDLLMGGSPCQDFSLAGLGAGGEKGSNTRSSLIWEQLRILKETMPKYYIWENVKNVLSKKHINVFNKHNEYVKGLGYKVYYKILNAKDFGIPQNRERVFVIGIRNDLDQDFDFNNLEKKPMNPLSYFLEPDVDESYFIKGGYLEKNKYNEFIRISDQSVRPTFKESKNGIITLPLSKNFTSNKVATGKGVIQTLTTLGNTKVLDYYKNENDKGLLFVKWDKWLWNVRTLTELESFRLMGFSDNDFYKAQKVATKQQLYKIAGNSIVVNKLESILKELFKEYRYNGN